MKTITLTNLDIQVLALSLADRVRKYNPSKIYGVPRGGIPIAYLVAGMLGVSVVDSAECSDVIVDDIIASGKTRDRFASLEKPFEALIPEPAPGEWYVFPWEGDAEGSAEDVPTRMLEYIGEDPSRDGLRDTPKRVVRSWGELFRGYGEDYRSVLKTFDNDGEYDQMIVCRNIEFFSTCEHHLLPFFGRVHVAYLPAKKGKIIGLSKLSRVVDCFARRAQVQERLTQQIAGALQDSLAPLGVGVMIEAQHLCMMARGVKQADASMLTTALTGVFKDDPRTREEFLAVVGGARR